MKVLLAIDSSSYSADATDLVASRPWPPDTIIKILSVVESIMHETADIWSLVGAVETLELVRREMTAQAEQLVTGAAEALRGSGLVVETSVVQGDPRSVIVDQAEKWSADLIVLGSRGYTGLKRLLLGSVAQFVVSHAPCSVEVVRKKRQTSPA